MELFMGQERTCKDSHTVLVSQLHRGTIYLAV